MPLTIKPSMPERGIISASNFTPNPAPQLITSVAKNETKYPQTDFLKWSRKRIIGSYQI